MHPISDLIQTMVWRNFYDFKLRVIQMKIKTIVHVAEEGGFWAEVPALPGCVTEGN